MHLLNNQLSKSFLVINHKLIINISKNYLICQETAEGLVSQGLQSIFKIHQSHLSIDINHFHIFFQLIKGILNTLKLNDQVRFIKTVP